MVGAQKIVKEEHHDEREINRSKCKLTSGTTKDKHGSLNWASSENSPIPTSLSKSLLKTERKHNTLIALGAK